MVIFVDQSAQWGGAELCLYQLVLKYQQSDDPCAVYLFENGPLAEALKGQGVTVRLSPSSDLLSLRKQSGWLAILKAVPHVWLLVYDLAVYCQPGMVLYANTLKAAVVCFLVAALKPVSVVWHVHDILNSKYLSWGLLRLLVAMSNGLSTHVIANSQATAASYRQSKGRRPLDVIYNAIDKEPFAVCAEQEPVAARHKLRLPEQYTLGIFGRVDEVKGQDILIRAISRLNGVQGLIVGKPMFSDGSYYQRLESMVEEHGLQERIVFTGFQKDVASWMAACDLVVLASTKFEGLGRVVIEAMLSKRLVIGTAGGGVIELIGESGERGFLVEAGNVEDLRKQILHVMGMPLKERSAIVERAYQYAVDTFAPESIFQQTRHIIHQYIRS